MRRAKRIVFWMLVIAAAMMWFAIGLSVFFGSGISIYSVLDESDWSQRSVEFESHTGAITVEYVPDHDPYHGPENTEAVVFDGWIGKPAANSAAWSWLVPRNTSPFMTSYGKGYRWELPLVSPAVLVAALPIFMFVRTRRRKPGRCAECGYNLAGTSGPCPECGTARTASP